MLHDLSYRLRALFRRHSMEAELDAELRAHVEQQAEKYVRSGLSPEEAARHARLEFGGLEQIKEECRDTWGVRIISELAQDLRYGLRQLRHNPGFTIVAVLTLALGIGVNTAIFSLLYDTILARLPLSHPQEIVQLSWHDGAESGSTFNWPDYRPLLAPKAVLPGLFAEMTQEMNLRYGDSSERVRAHLVSATYYSTLEVDPFFGRVLTPADGQANAKPAAVLSYAYWRRRFGLNPGMVGQPIYIDGKAFTVVGVTRPKFYGLDRLSPPDVTLPLRVAPLPEGKSYYVSLFTRLEPGKPIAQAQAQLSVRFEQLLGTELEPEQGWMGHVRLTLLPAATGEESARLPLEEPLLVLESLAGAVLLICLSNLATLLLVRATGRSREIAVRLALGATRWRTIRQLLVESMLLGVGGGVVALLAGYWIHRLLLTQLALDSSEALQFGPTAPAMIFTMGLSLFAGALVGLLPALRGSKMSINMVIKGEPPVGGLKSVRPMRAFLGVQIAASLVLLASAMLFIRTLRNLGEVRAGFDRRHVLLMTIDPKESRFHGKRVNELLGRLREQVSAVPGVRSVSVSEWPLFGNGASKDVWLSGSPPCGEPVAFNVVGPGFFATNGVPLILGRVFTVRDREGAPRVAIVNEAFARKHFPGQSPVGQRFGDDGPGSAGQWEIIGVVGDSRYSSLRLAPAPAIFTPFLQSPQDVPLALTIRGTGKASGTAGAVRRAIQAIDPGLVVYNVRTMTEQVEGTLRRESTFAALSGLFAALALCLCCIGLYGVTSYSVSQRTHEIGIRMALGAERRDVLRMVIGQGLKLVLVGVALGIAGALVLTRFLASLLYGVKPTDPLTFIAVSLILIAVALLACYIPARRAAKVDPMVALRYE